MQVEKKMINDECRSAQERLIGLCLGATDESDSSVLLDHLSQCPGCLKRYIALQAASDMAAERFTRV